MLREFAVRLRRVGRDTDHLGPGRRVILPAVAHRAHLPRADWRLVAGIEQQHHDLSALLREPPRLTIGVVQSEIRGGRADFRGLFHRGLFR